MTTVSSSHVAFCRCPCHYLIKKCYFSTPGIRAALSLESFDQSRLAAITLYQFRAQPLTGMATSASCFLLPGSWLPCKEQDYPETKMLWADPGRTGRWDSTLRSKETKVHQGAGHVEEYDILGCTLLSSWPSGTHVGGWKTNHPAEPLLILDGKNQKEGKTVFFFNYQEIFNEVGKY